MRKYSLFILLTFMCHVFLHGQEINVDVKYKMSRVDGFAKKIGIATSINMLVDGQAVNAEPVEGNFQRWRFTGQAHTADAYFKSDESKGIWWEVIDGDHVTTVLLSKSIDDTNDPREFIVTSTSGRSLFKVFNEEPDCNSEFILLEAAESPTLLTGVAKTMAYIKNKKPCSKGVWSISVEETTQRHILIASVFAAIQSLNIRHLDEL